MKSYALPITLSVIVLLAGIFWFLGSPQGAKYLDGESTTSATPATYSNESAGAATATPASATKVKSAGSDRITRAPARHVDRKAESLKPNKSIQATTTKHVAPQTAKVTRLTEKSPQVHSTSDVSKHPHFADKSPRTTTKKKPPTGHYWIGVNGTTTDLTIPIAIGAPYTEGQIKDFARINSGQLGLTTEVIKRDFFEKKAGAYYLKCRVNRNVAEFSTK